MASRSLSPETRLSVHLDAICSRNRYTSDPAPVIAELLAAAGDRLDIPAESVGTWVGYFDDEDTRILCTALRELPGLEPWIALGRKRFEQPHQRTPGVLTHSSVRIAKDPQRRGSVVAQHLEPASRRTPPPRIGDLVTCIGARSRALS